MDVDGGGRPARGQRVTDDRGRSTLMPCAKRLRLRRPAPLTSAQPENARRWARRPAGVSTVAHPSVAGGRLESSHGRCQDAAARWESRSRSSTTSAAAPPMSRSAAASSRRRLARRPGPQARRPRPGTRPGSPPHRPPPVGSQTQAAWWMRPPRRSRRRRSVGTVSGVGSRPLGGRRRSARGAACARCSAGGRREARARGGGGRG